MWNLHILYFLFLSQLGLRSTCPTPGLKNEQNDSLRYDAKDNFS